MSKFAETLSELMVMEKVSQKRLAEVLGVKQQTVSRYINGDREPNIETIVLIAQFFDVTTDYLLGLSEE